MRCSQVLTGLSGFISLVFSFGLFLFLSDTVLAGERSGAALYFQVEVEVVLTFVLYIMSRDFSWT